MKFAFADIRGRYTELMTAMACCPIQTPKKRPRLVSVQSIPKAKSGSRRLASNSDWRVNLDLATGRFEVGGPVSNTEFSAALVVWRGLHARYQDLRRAGHCDKDGVLICLDALRDVKGFRVRASFLPSDSQ